MHKKRYKVDVFRAISKFFGNSASRKGQVTIFIILGLLLVIAVVLVLVLRSELAITKPEEIEPVQITSIENLVTACISQIGSDALFKMGQQGGFIEVPAEINNDPNRHLRVADFVVVPYWAYGDQTDVPTLLNLKQRLDSEIEAKLRDCVLGEDFSEKYDFIEKSELSADTEILDTKVVFNVKWNLEVRDKAGEVVVSAVDHVAESPVKLKLLRDVAERIINQEMADFKLEDITQDLISLEHPNVPVNNFEMSCSKRRWEVDKVEETLKDMIRINLNELRVRGTDYVEFPEELPYYNSHYIWNLGDELISNDVSVNFRFDNAYPFFFDVTPRSGNYLVSNQIGGNSDLLSFFCMQNWKFIYDVTYPVVVTLTDETSNYDFKMALTVHLGKNIPDRSQSLTKVEVPYINSFTDVDFCQDATVPVTVSTFELIDNPNTGVFSREPLEDVGVSLSCLKYKCEVGKTEYDFAGRGNVASYSTNVPHCVGGILRGEKEGYKEQWSRIVTEAGQEYEVEMIPVLDVPVANIKVLKHEIGDAGVVGPGVEISGSEVALVKIKFDGKNDSFGGVFHEASTVITSEIDEDVLAETKLQLLGKADFNYDLDITLLDGDRLIGGYQGEWNALWFDLLNAREIVFHVPSKKSMSDEEMYLFMTSIPVNSVLVPAAEVR